MPTLSSKLKSKLLSISTQALRIVVDDLYHTFNSDELHVMLNRFTPAQWRVYNTLICIYRVFNNQIPLEIWTEMQFNALPLTSANKTLFPPGNKQRVGHNSLINRLSFVSTLITNSQLNLEYSSFKIIAKKIAMSLSSIT